MRINVITLCLVLVTVTSVQVEILRMTIFCATSGKVRAFIMTTLGVLGASFTFILVFLDTLLVANALGIVTITNITENAIWCLITAGLLTIGLYTFVFQRLIQTAFISFYLKMARKVIKEERLLKDIETLSPEELRAKEKVTQFYNGIGTLIGIGYGWFYIGDKSSIQDVLNSTTSMFTLFFVVGSIVYTTVRHLPFVDNETKY